MNIHWKDWCWSSNTLATWCKEMAHWKTSWCWERLKARGEGGNRGWDGWMASLTQWIMSLRKLQELVKEREAWRATVHEVTKIWTWLSDWTIATMKLTSCIRLCFREKKIAITHCIILWFRVRWPSIIITERVSHYSDHTSVRIIYCEPGMNSDNEMMVREWSVKTLPAFPGSKEKSGLGSLLAFQDCSKSSSELKHSLLHFKPLLPQLTIQSWSCFVATKNLGKQIIFFPRRLHSSQLNRKKVEDKHIIQSTIKDP